ncbi:MAG: hypothetical protein N2C14_21525 [Planctomycetales bacterium]
MRPTDLTDLDKRLLAYLAGGLSADETKAIEVELADDAAAERLMRLAGEETTIRAWARAYSHSRQLDEEEAGVDRDSD